MHPFDRYLFPISEDRISGDMTFLVQWDDDDFSARAIVCNVVAVDVETGETIYMEGANVRTTNDSVANPNSSYISTVGQIAIWNGS